ncbi:24775_t:CDS:1, partial [Gigaspora margarita]
LIFNYLETKSGIIQHLKHIACKEQSEETYIADVVMPLLQASLENMLDR